MKKYIVSLALLSALVLYVVFANQKQPGIAINASNRDKTQTGTNTGSTKQQGLITKWKDGSYDGPVTDAFYGPLQVEAVVQNGKLADVRVLKYPNDQNTSIEVNDSALPNLVSEAVQTQSWNVNVVSGATQSSEAFSQSLQAALAAAKA